jgi:hypothetical protein
MVEGQFMCTWITEKNNRVGRICQTHDGVSPGPEWIKVPNDWNGNPGDRLDWFDADMRRIPDHKLVADGIRVDHTGIWYGKTSVGESKRIHGLDEVAGEDWTRKKPPENEPYLKWDGEAGSWVVDTGAKEKAEKERDIAHKKAEIEDAEKRIQRSLIAREAGTVTEEDERYFDRISAEIVSLREELRQLVAA